MEHRNHRFAAGAARTVSALALVAAMAFVPPMAFAYQSDAHQDRVETRIKNMHAKLKITEAQEVQWTKLTEVMRDNAKAMDALTQTRVDNAKTMTAVDDLKSYGEITEAHAAAMKKFTPAFSDLYDTMSEAQKKDADALFRHGPGKHGDKISKNK